jgi:hypothetical protein
LNGVCECVDGLTRPNGSGPCEVGGLVCSKSDVAGICDRCDSDLGLFYGDCLSCLGDFFLQPGSRSCLNYCPSGTLPGLANRCGDFDVTLVLDATFDLRDRITSTGFGTITLPGGDFDPASIFNRGFYFDGVKNRLDITGLILNTQFTVITWLKHTTEADVGIQPIFSFDSPVPESNPGRFNIQFESRKGLLGRIDLSLKVHWDAFAVYFDDHNLDF